jgi:hypothetical protein
MGAADGQSKNDATVPHQDGGKFPARISQDCLPGNFLLLNLRA